MGYSQVVVSRRGGPDVLETVKARPAPPPPGHAVVRVEAAGVSFGDVLLRVGVIPGGPKPPFVPGYDVTGVVEAVGEGVSAPVPGQRVVALVREGGYAQVATVPADRLIPVPDGVDTVEVAAMALNYFVAYQMLHRIARVRAGQTVLVHGAGGGVGTALLQLAALHEVVCYGTSSAAKRDVVVTLGGRHIDYRAEDFNEIVRALPGGGVSAVFDPVGGTHFHRSYRALRRPGILVAYGQSQALDGARARRPVAVYGFLGGLFAPKLLPDGKATRFYNAWSLEKKEPAAYREDMTAILGLLAAGDIKPVVARTLPLGAAAEAHVLLERSAVAGKLVLRCDDDSAAGTRSELEEKGARG